jgi:hypothetical protein
MKFFLSLFSLVLASACAKMPVFPKHRKLTKLPDTVDASSKVGSIIMANARRLDQNGDISYTWVSDYSIKFQGCHHISQWNDEADGEEDVRIATKRLVRFRLCPSNTCSVDNSGGCSSGYGDYVIDMNVYLEAFLESVGDYNEARCEYLEAQSGCEGANNEEYCLYDYYAANGVADVCADGNPYQNNYNNGDQQEAFDISEYTECVEANMNGGNGQAYYMGPYCAEQGGSIYLGLFTDDSCTTFADDYGGKEAYYTLTGQELPYGATNMITMDCYSCMEAEAQYNYNGNDNDDADNVSEMCEQIYSQAGKCESALQVNGLYPNYAACSYIQGIQVIRKNGIIVRSGSKANKTASIFIGIFVVAFVLLSAYVYYLKTKL